MNFLWLRGVIVFLLVVPFFCSLNAGNDLDLVAGLRVHWFVLWPAAITISWLILSMLANGKPRWYQQLFFGIALIAAMAVVLVAWVGGVKFAGISITDPWRPALIGTVAGLLSLLLPPPAFHLPLSRPGLLTSLISLALGAVTALSAFALDRRELLNHFHKRNAASQADVVFILVDTLRADALGAYGAKPSPSPFLDKLHQQSLSASLAMAQAPWTFPSVSSLMTSRYPSSLNPNHRGAQLAARDQPNSIPSIPSNLPRLASHLQKNGYHTAGFQKTPFLAKDRATKLDLISMSS